MTERLDVPAASPLLRAKDYAAPSVFTPEGLLREARRQKDLPVAAVPPVCLLDPDGDIAGHRVAAGRAERDPHWACYHTALHRVAVDGLEIGIVGGAVGAPFAVLVAEELFACGCRLLLSVTSAGQIMPAGEPPYFVLIERALRDEGTSLHYQPPARYSHLAPALAARLRPALAALPTPVYVGAAWTTDAPFRETAAAIAAARAEGILAVEMESAALYAMAAARGRAVACFAQVTNQMATVEGDFEKGAGGGSLDALAVVVAATRAWLAGGRDA